MKFIFRNINRKIDNLSSYYILLLDLINFFLFNLIFVIIFEGQERTMINNIKEIRSVYVKMSVCGNCIRYTASVSNR